MHQELGGPPTVEGGGQEPGDVPGVEADSVGGGLTRVEVELGVDALRGIGQ